ncbi:phenylacetate-CoA oxygenase subunit PaaJ [Chitinophaga silvatica]|uniref:Phenylacetate-CoA oxygenase subunit PaaJ n=1 Tax=Chitinophaga silvatica TaxID=2282649 RepID=A0A3E1YBE1_9BACT|nr:1,2-phenylacetyl-CoA epoxidase subunit PaaD [Chitinophaga silvatica]RFS23372.1 phenylacetate-CoA oxygenase subunit PaaJ [Chitinophaga silvatica]
MITLPSKEAVYKMLEEVMDPEIPVLSVVDLGMITDVEVLEDEVRVKMIPTFAACPAVNYIQTNIKRALEERLEVPVSVTIDKSVNWSSSRMTAAAKEKLKNYGIAPPPKEQAADPLMLIAQEVPCPHCGSKQTYLRSPFGATLCRALHYCKECGQVFEQFKPLD